MPGKRFTISLFTALLLLALASPSHSETDWGIKGVHDTTKVNNIVQLTTGQDQSQGSNFLNSGDTTLIRPWSKDGQWIVFSAEVDGTSLNDRDICKIRATGTGFKQLTKTGSAADSNTSFSIDNKIYYSSDDGSSNYYIWRMPADGSSHTNLTDEHSGAATERYPQVSPDGTKVAYIKDSLLYVAPANGTSEKQVSGKWPPPNSTTNITVNSGHYSWSPDSQWLVYSGDNGDSVTGYWLFKVKADGTGHAQLTSRGTDQAYIYHQWPSWSPDGSKIAYIWLRYNSNLVEPNSKSYYEIRLISSADGSGSIKLDEATNDITTGWQNFWGPLSWSPDSKWLSYVKSYKGAGPPDDPYYKAIFIIPTKSINPVPAQLTIGYNDTFPIWSPDGKKIVFQSQNHELSREDDDYLTCCNDPGDILILNLIGDYGSSVSLFPWHMFMPAVQSGNKK